MADDADWQMSSVTSFPPTQRELRHVIVQLMTSPRSRDTAAVSRGASRGVATVSLQRSTILSSEMYVSQAPGGTTGLRHPNAAGQYHQYHSFIHSFMRKLAFLATPLSHYFSSSLSPCGGLIYKTS